MSWEFDELINKARHAEDVGDLWVAHQSLGRALELDPADTPTWTWYGHICNQLEQFAEAIHAFEHAIELEPTFSGAYSGLATALVEAGRLQEAEQALSESVRLRPTSSRFVLLADVQTQLHQDAKAEASLRQALRLDANDDEALFNLALLIRDRDAEESIQLFGRALEVDPQYAAAYRELGWTYLRKGSLDKAQRALENAIRLEDNDARAHLYLGHLLVERGKTRDAQDAFDRARFLSPLWTLPILLKGRLLEDDGRMPEAEAAFRMAVEMSPSDADCLAELGRHLLSSKKVVEAEKLLREALRLQPGHKAALDGIASLRSGNQEH